MVLQISTSHLQAAETGFFQDLIYDCSPTFAVAKEALNLSYNLELDMELSTSKSRDLPYDMGPRNPVSAGSIFLHQSCKVFAAAAAEASWSYSMRTAIGSRNHLSYYFLLLLPSHAR